MAGRKQHEDELEARIAEWTCTRSAQDVMWMLQRAGVPAGVCEDAPELVDKDPQLKLREFLKPVENPVIGVFGHPTPPFLLSATPSDVKRAPLFGEHNEKVCTEFLGLSKKEYEEFRKDNVFV
jgi:crotonobetainyl-CoA:carnitine CoA-transferase CaiB-like acyl-CoA transferase